MSTGNDSMFEKLTEEFGRIEKDPNKNVDEQEVKEQKEIPVGFDIHGNEITKGDEVSTSDANPIQGRVDAVWDDGSVDIQYTSGPGGPLSDTFDIKGHGVQKLEADADESKTDEQEVKEGDGEREGGSGKTGYTLHAPVGSKVVPKDYIVNFKDLPKNVEFHPVLAFGLLGSTVYKNVSPSEPSEFASKNSSEVEDPTMGWNYSPDDLVVLHSDVVSHEKEWIQESKTNEQEEVDQRELPGYEDDAAVEPMDIDNTVETLHEMWLTADFDTKVKLITFIETMLKMAQQVVESKTDEKKKPPVCKKCNKAHWPFKKCSAKESEEQEEVKEDTKGFLPRNEIQQLIDAWELISQHDDDPNVRTMAEEKAEELEMILLAGQEDEADPSVEYKDPGEYSESKDDEVEEVNKQEEVDEQQEVGKPKDLLREIWAAKSSDVSKLSIDEQDG